VNAWEDGVGSPGDREGLPPRRRHRLDGVPGGDPQQPEHPEAAEWLGDLLRVEAAQHEPDRDRILALMTEREQAEYDVPASVSSLGVRRRDQVSREGRGRGRPASGGGRMAWPLVAAGVAVLTMATVAGARVLAPGEDTKTTTTPEVTPTSSTSLGPPVSIDPRTSQAGGGTTASSTGTSPSPSSSSGTSPSTTWTSQAQGSQPPPGLPGGAVSIRVMPTGEGTRLALPRSSSDRDWIAVGSRGDGKLVRAKNPSRPLGTVTVSGYGPSIVQGPYQVSWSGGLPEQERTVDTTWQSITAVDGRIRMTVPPRGDRFTIDLFAGTVKTTGLVRVSFGGSADAVETQLKQCGRDICPAVVSITVDSARLPGGGMSGDLVIDLGPARPGDGLGLGLAAVVLH
jgi:hypothetical protein